MSIHARMILDSEIFKEKGDIYGKHLNLYDPTRDKVCESNVARHQEILYYNKALSINPENQSTRPTSSSKNNTDVFCSKFLNGIHMDLDAYDVVLSPKANCILVTLGLGIGFFGLGMILSTSILMAAGTITTAIMINKCSNPNTSFCDYDL